MERQREYPQHVVLVNEELCTWGPPVAILQRRKSCEVAGVPHGRTDGRTGRPEPVITGLGPISRETIDRYRTMAVMLFEDGPNAPGSGSRVAGIVTTLLLDLDMNMVERAKLDEVLKEQVIQLTHADDANVLKVGKLVGAHAIIVGGVQQWEQHEQARTSSVSLSLRMIDVETGQLLFNGEGHLTDPTRDDAESAARLIVHRILARFGSQTGLLGSGRIGVNWELLESGGSRYYAVRELRSGLPAEKAGLHVGDQVVGCNGSSLAGVKSEREAKRVCQIEAGQRHQHLDRCGLVEQHRDDSGRRRQAPGQLLPGQPGRQDGRRLESGIRQDRYRERRFHDDGVCNTDRESEHHRRRQLCGHL